MAKQTEEMTRQTVSIPVRLKARLEQHRFETKIPDQEVVAEALSRYFDEPIDRPHEPKNNEEREFVSLALDFYRVASPRFRETVRGLMEEIVLKSAPGDGSPESGVRGRSE